MKVSGSAHSAKIGQGTVPAGKPAPHAKPAMPAIPTPRATPDKADAATGGNYDPASGCSEKDCPT